MRKVVEHARQVPAIEAISITSATFMERAHSLCESLGFRRAPERAVRGCASIAGMAP